MPKSTFIYCKKCFQAVEKTKYRKHDASCDGRVQTVSRPLTQDREALPPAPTPYQNDPMVIDQDHISSILPANKLANNHNIDNMSILDRSNRCSFTPDDIVYDFGQDDQPYVTQDQDDGDNDNYTNSSDSNDDDEDFAIMDASNIDDPII
ncbi:hypothetical protein INT45_001820 [Circinella minor]|uniref:Uncharacterized protein n=1 Tax=Circinella minor TaxID=1195481 RepID=A0A8H7RRJ7_9FUNG|nr:hypothetical protein INT45_001820 [Circinella minor]